MCESIIARAAPSECREVMGVCQLLTAAAFWIGKRLTSGQSPVPSRQQPCTTFPVFDAIACGVTFMQASTGCNVRDRHEHVHAIPQSNTQEVEWQVMNLIHVIADGLRKPGDHCGFTCPRLEAESFRSARRDNAIACLTTPTSVMFRRLAASWTFILRTETKS